MHKSPNSPMACRLQNIWGKIAKHCGQGFWDVLGADLSEVG